MRICVYGAASPLIDDVYMEKVEELGKELARRGHSLVFGGGGHGLMGAVARGVKSENGYLLGVIPKFFAEEDIEVVCTFCDALIQPDTMRERKQIMDDNADAFIVVPGGIGTLEEYFEILTAKQLCRHAKPIAIYNVCNFYSELETMLQKATEKRFIKEDVGQLYKITDSLSELFDYIEGPTVKFSSVKELKDG